MFTIVISGAFRNLSETWPANKKYFDAIGENYQVYVHTWSKNFGTPRNVHKDQNWRGFSVNLRPRKYKTENFDVTERLVKSVIPNAIVILEKFDQDSIIEKYGIPSKKDSSIHQNILNSVAMYQGISRGFAVALQSDKSNSSAFFVRLRTDFLLNQFIPLPKPKIAVYFAGPGVDPGFGYVSDQFFICDRETAKIIANCEFELKSYVDVNGWGINSRKPFYGERILSYILKDTLNYKNVLKSPILGEIMRPEIVEDSETKYLDFLIKIIKYNFVVFLRKLKTKISRLKFLRDS